MHAPADRNERIQIREKTLEFSSIIMETTLITSITWYFCWEKNSICQTRLKLQEQTA